MMQGKDATTRNSLLRLGRRLLALCCLCSSPAWGTPLVLLSEGSAIYREVGAAIEAAYAAPLEIRTVEQRPAQTPLPADTAVAVGARACEQLLQASDETPSLICAFIPRATFISLAERYGSTDLVRQRRLTAIYLDQPLERQLRLARLLVPKAKSIGAMFGPFSVAERKVFALEAEAQGLSPVTLSLEESDNPIEKLQPVVRRSDVFLALPDRALFNRATAKWLLYVTLQQQIPVIGFSRTYVEAGALAAVYTTPAQVGQQAGELLSELSKGEALPTPAFPRYFTVTTNPVVARNLALPLPDDRTLTERLAEEAP